MMQQTQERYNKTVGNIPSNTRVVVVHGIKQDDEILKAQSEYLTERGNDYDDMKEYNRALSATLSGLANEQGPYDHSVPRWSELCASWSERFAEVKQQMATGEYINGVEIKYGLGIALFYISTCSSRWYMNKSDVICYMEFLSPSSDKSK